MKLTQQEKYAISEQKAEAQGLYLQLCILEQKIPDENLVTLLNHSNDRGSLFTVTKNFKEKIESYGKN